MLNIQVLYITTSLCYNTLPIQNILLFYVLLYFIKNIKYHKRYKQFNIYVFIIILRWNIYKYITKLRR